MDFDDLPDELLLKICIFLPVSDLCRFRSASKRFDSLLNAEQFWKRLCLRDYKAECGQVWYGWTYREFYANVLHKFRHFLGIWRRNLDNYGGLVKVQVNRDGIGVYECLPPYDENYTHITDIARKIQVSPAFRTYSENLAENLHKFRYRLIFNMKPVGKDVHCFCYQSLLGHWDRIGHSTLLDSARNLSNFIGRPPAADESRDNCCVIMSNGDDVIGGQGSSDAAAKRKPFSFLCHRFDQHDFDFDYWFEIEHGFRSKDRNLITEIVTDFYHDLHYFVRVKKFETLTNASTRYDLIPWEPQNLSPKNKAPPFNMPIKPGLYSGTYSAHGWEIIDLRYNEDMSCIEAVKVSGDVNVTAGQVTFRVYPKKPLHFTRSDQQSLRTVNDALSRNQRCQYAERASTAERDSCSPWQHYAVPADCLERSGGHTETGYCSARFEAEGQIAGDFFTNPSYITCVCSVFREDRFALLWLDLRSVSSFYRLNDAEDRAPAM